ncbi:MAG: methylmalonyl Co-A mutase-associated GTPase MeaB [Cytophagaceae bacterium]
MALGKNISEEKYISGIAAGNRVILSKAITLTESKKEEDINLSLKVLEGILPHTGKSLRIGLTGAPGAGKSTFIEALGNYLIKIGKKPAVLAIDPSSMLTGGSILGDKTRMEKLAFNENAFVRPSPAGDNSGGIAEKTREAILLCEAAGFDPIIVETVGVGQTEAEVYNMTDLYVLLLLTGAGDELQAIKKGINEIADIFIINKADGLNKNNAEKLQKELSYIVNEQPLLTHSNENTEDIKHFWEIILQEENKRKQNKIFFQKRKNQNLDWLQKRILKILKQEFFKAKAVQENYEYFEQQVIEGQIAPAKAAQDLFNIYTNTLRNPDFVFKEDKI